MLLPDIYAQAKKWETSINMETWAGTIVSHNLEFKPSNTSVDNTMVFKPLETAPYIPFQFMLQRFYVFPRSALSRGSEKLDNSFGTIQTRELWQCFC